MTLRIPVFPQLNLKLSAFRLVPRGNAMKMAHGSQVLQAHLRQACDWTLAVRYM